MYFLKGVAIQAGDVVSRIKRIDDLLSSLRLELSRGTLADSPHGARSVH